eukprot:NODE_79_length_22985_cov_0.358401.p8 type:complete len:244 gc:universal NODE_79_length_22985_cov_0.358401:12450-13181(+)
MISLFLSTASSQSANWFTDTYLAPYNYFKSTITVPKIPPKEWKTLFLWPGLQPGGGKNYYPIDNGVLQPVLTYGESCAPNPLNSNNQTLKNYENSWWISAQYVNTVGTFPNYSGCYGGERMKVKAGDSLDLIFEFKKPIWRQKVLNLRNYRSVSFDIDMLGQAQGWAEWVVEPAGGWHKHAPQFNVTNIELRTATSHPKNFCVYSQSISPDFTGANLNCAQPKFPKPNICRISSCVFNLPNNK